MLSLPSSTSPSLIPSLLLSTSSPPLLPSILSQPFIVSSSSSGQRSPSSPSSWTSSVPSMYSVGQSRTRSRGSLQPGSLPAQPHCPCWGWVGWGGGGCDDSDCLGGKMRREHKCYRGRMTLTS
ncbi:hypothetical protein MUK42_35367 [Musa troglodytarum]|uniref:Uncharacterized protein n=1 Tax=Musa troglodytarum TaxID=320322 RepID=A0A9E7L1D2_9LILI|nr:hypothetical protein MUK42_35367 [Musa troglodytarum]